MAAKFSPLKTEKRTKKLQLPPSREEVWPRLEELGEQQVREMLAKGQFGYIEEETVEEWLSRRASADAIREAKSAKRISVIGAIAAVVAAIASTWQLFK